MNDIDEAFLKRLRHYATSPMSAGLKGRVLGNAAAAMVAEAPDVANPAEVRNGFRFLLAAAAVFLAVLIAGSLLNGSMDGGPLDAPSLSARDLALLKEFDMPSRHMRVVAVNPRFDMKKRFELEGELR